MIKGLILYPKYELIGFFPFFLELGDRLAVSEDLKKGLSRTVDKWERMFQEQKAQAKSEKDPDYRSAILNLRETIPYCLTQIKEHTTKFSSAQSALLDIIENVSTDSLQTYVQKHGFVSERETSLPY